MPFRLRNRASVWSVPYGTVLLLFVTALPAPAQVFGGKRRPAADGCPSTPCSPLEKLPAVEQPPPAAEPAQEPILAPEQFAATGSGETFAAYAPNMIGDNGGACGKVLFEGVTIAELDHPTFACSRTKIADNNSPLPRDRVYFIYQSFQEATSTSVTASDPLGALSFDSASVDVNKYTFGLEKTFFDGSASFQIQLPFATNLTNRPFFNFDAPAVAPDETNTNIRNLAMALKLRLWQSERLFLTGGGLLQVPTAPDVIGRAFSANDPLIDIDHRFAYRNRAVILSPFLGALATPTDRLFLQGFAQVDVDLNGDRFDFDPVVNGQPLARQSFRVSQQTLMRLDAGAGRWFYRNPQANRITGIAASLEVHWTSTLNDAHVVTFVEPGFGSTVQVGNTANRTDPVYLTLGPTVEFANRSTLAVGFVAPLRTGDDRGFDWELNVQLNYRFGYRGL